MQLPFYKYQGAGNDFIILDGSEAQVQLTYQQISALCDRHFGIGADGLMIYRKSPEADFEMLYYNSDGYPGSMCGNGARCILRFVWDKQYCKSPCTFMAPDGKHDARLLRENNWISVSMKSVEQVEKLDNGDYCLDTGSPHYITWKNPDTTDVVKEGRGIRNSDRFREKGINVNFAEIKNDVLRLRTYERGVEDETLSCGTGVTASVIAAAASGKIDAAAGLCNVETRGGNLRVMFNQSNDIYTSVRLEGPAEKVFEGTINL